MLAAIDSGNEPEDGSGIGSPISGGRAVQRGPAARPKYSSGTKHGGGPQTEEGKKAVSGNAISHGLSSPSPVAGGEREEDWERFHKGISQSLKPVGMLEEELVNDIALTLWRKRRVVKYETGAVQTRSEAVGTVTDSRTVNQQILSHILETVPILGQVGLLDDSTKVDVDDGMDVILLLNRLVEDAPEFPEFPNGCTLGDLRCWIDGFATQMGMTTSEAVRLGLAFAERVRQTIPEPKPEVPKEQQERRALLPSPEDLDRIIRYEAHLNKSFDQKLRQLEQLQRASSGDLGPHPDRVVIIEA